MRNENSGTTGSLISNERRSDSLVSELNTIIIHVSHRLLSFFTLNKNKLGGTAEKTRGARVG